MADMFQSFEGT